MSTPGEVRKSIKSGTVRPLYLLEGDDLQSRHDLALEFAGLVDEGLQAFNVQNFYANEATNAPARDQLIAAVLSSSRTLPMMSDRRVVIVHESDRLLAPKRAKDDADTLPELDLPKKGKRTATPTDELEQYVQDPEPMTTLVFMYGLMKYMFKGSGSDTARAEGRKLMLWGLIGIFVMISVWGLVGMIKGLFKREYWLMIIRAGVRETNRAAKETKRGERECGEEAGSSPAR